MDNVPVHIRSTASAGRNDKQKKSKIKIVAIVIGLILALAIMLGGWFMYLTNTASANIDGSKYQAVFFTNGQVYFGKLTNLSGGYFKLNKIFYLQADTTKDISGNPQSTSSQVSDVQLIKLGSEVHGPDDEMIISKDQILFFENLKNDGKVTTAITKYNNQKK